MFNFLKPSPDAKVPVPADKVEGVYKRKQTGVLIATCISYLAYYIIRLIFTTEQKPIIDYEGIRLLRGANRADSFLFWGRLRDRQALYGRLGG